jgi:hypothetical protein
MTKRAVIVAVLVVGAVIGLTVAGWKWYNAQNVRLSEEPERRASTLKLASEESAVAVRIDVSLAALRNAAEQAVPASYPFGGNGEDACVDLRLLGKHCAGTHYSGSVQRTGPISVANGSNNTLVLSVPLKVEGRGGLRGDGARLVGLDAKNFRASVIVGATVGADIGSDWCPVVTVTPSFNWTETPRVEIVERVWTVVTGQVEPQLRSKLDEMAAKVRESINCDQFRTEVRRVWRVHALPIQLPQVAAFANITPISMGFSGVTVTPEQIRFAIGLRANTELGTVAAEERSIGELPPLARLQDAPGHLALSIPVRVQYGVMQEALSQVFRDRSFVQDTPAGKATVQVKNVFVYPSGERLALGVECAAQMPRRLLDVGGRIYLTVRPSIDAEKMVVRLVDPQFARILNNDVWSAASVVFENQIKELITKHAAYDFAGDVEKLTTEIRHRLADPTLAPGLRINVRDVSTSVKTILPEADSLATLLRASIGVDIMIDPLGFPK